MSLLVLRPKSQGFVQATTALMPLCENRLGFEFLRDHVHHHVPHYTVIDQFGFLQVLTFAFLAICGWEVKYPLCQ